MGSTQVMPVEQQNTLAEMRLRHILAAEASQWAPEDMKLLVALKNAEAAGALGLLKNRESSLDGLVVAHKPAGSMPKKWRLTKKGYHRYLFLNAQDARGYFETKEIAAKQIFSLRDTDGRPLFSDDGLLTPEGASLYNKARRGEKAFWLLPSGEISGNRNPDKR